MVGCTTFEGANICFENERFTEEHNNLLLNRTNYYQFESKLHCTPLINYNYVKVLFKAKR